MQQPTGSYGAAPRPVLADGDACPCVAKASIGTRASGRAGRPTKSALLRGLVALSCLAEGSCAAWKADRKTERELAPARWWCAADGHAGSTFCATTALREAIAAADAAARPAAVELLKTAIADGRAEAEGLALTNPDRQRAMEAWCASADPARTQDPKSGFLCAKTTAKADFFKRREVLLATWCDTMGKAGSPKCKQMAFGKKMQETESGEERKRLAVEFKSATTQAERDALEAETSEMMAAVCATHQEALFEHACAKLPEV